jgi:hypothetical protein
MGAVRLPITTVVAGVPITTVEVAGVAIVIAGVATVVAIATVAGVVATVVATTAGSPIVSLL